jgi:hypothetical protein
MNNKSMIPALLSALVLGLLSTASHAYGVSHHGGMILDCTAPTFFDESPPKESKVAALDKFSFTASENTEAQTLKVWVNAQPVAFTVKPELSGRLHVEAKLDPPLAQGKAWIKVTGDSNDGCDQLHTWNVYLGQ